jgi:hypothetical protein
MFFGSIAGGLDQGTPIAEYDTRVEVVKCHNSLITNSTPEGLATMHSNSYHSI